MSQVPHKDAFMQVIVVVTSVTSSGAPAVSNEEPQCPQCPQQSHSTNFSPAGPADRNHKLQEHSEGPDAPLLVEPEAKTPQGYEQAFRDTKTAFLEQEGKTLALKNIIVEKDIKIHERDAQILEMKAVILKRKATINQRDQVSSEERTKRTQDKHTDLPCPTPQTINQLKLEANNLKAKSSKLKAENKHVHALLTAAAPGRRRSEPTVSTPDVDAAVRNNANKYGQTNTPRESTKADHDHGRFEEDPNDGPGTGKVWPGKSGSNGGTGT
ncbi:hypothetical protein DDE82_006366 [Stemphylium lycopersici]|uniref:Uncharacterized protein n=1 Tax=Stemphylium lycopersici TaxID=183478 RepID=A0A364N2X4_STELY|nr:hypothetical protein TW65_06364 [Stemphylium lycopersici]RAR01617.1 hypothetical protein DDE82_006366 [Stemphylium lycopersici]RAR10207.1 hypothetical protein DDE83_005168 [Stemphylium lycopersici]